MKLKVFKFECNTKDEYGHFEHELKEKVQNVKNFMVPGVYLEFCNCDRLSGYVAVFYDPNFHSEEYVTGEAHQMIFNFLESFQVLN